MVKKQYTPTTNNTQSFYLHAKKSLGQNFLRDEAIINKIASAIDTLFVLQPKYVHEIGPGSGSLSLALLQKDIKIKAIEKDERSVSGLKETLCQNHKESFEIVLADILKWSPESDDNLLHNENLKKNCLCVGNLPYYITSDILLWFCKHYKHYRYGIFMVQNEVADRLQAQIKTKDYGRLSVKMQLFFNVKKLFVVPAKSFVPTPKVDSAIILLEPKNFSFASEQEEKKFGSFTALLFSARRKMLRRAIVPLLENLEKSNPEKLEKFWEFANQLEVYEETRPDSISPEAILALHKYFL